MTKITRLARIDKVNLEIKQMVNKIFTDTPKIWIGCLAAYNAGELHGEWVEANQSVECLEKEIEEILGSSPEEDAEEWMVSDYDNFGSFGDLLGEYPSLDDVSRAAFFYAEHKKLAEIAFKYCENLDEAIDMVEERYAGCYASLGDFAEEYFRGFSTIPKELEYYIDWEKMGSDMEINGVFCSFEVKFQQVHIFYEN